MAVGIGGRRPCCGRALIMRFVSRMASAASPLVIEELAALGAVGAEREGDLVLALRARVVGRRHRHQRGLRSTSTAERGRVPPADPAAEDFDRGESRDPW